MMKNLKKRFRIWMLPIAVTLFSTLMTNCTNAQNNELPRTIEVTGSAEMAINPDLIKLDVVITEDFNKNKKDDFLKILKKNGVTDDKIAFHSQQENWWYYYHYYNHTEVRYTITVDSTVNAMGLMEDLKEPWVRRINISEKTNTQLQAYRKEVKIEAVKAAKEKAAYMLEALGEELGAVVSIEEVNTDKNQTNPYYWWGANNTNSMASNSVVSSSKSGNNYVPGVSMQKLRYEVKITFYIK